MSKTIRSTDPDAKIRKADRRRNRVVRAQKKNGAYFPPEYLGYPIDAAGALTDGYYGR